MFLPTCEKEERQVVFGKVDNYYAESEDGTSLVAFNEKKAFDLSNVI